MMTTQSRCSKVMRQCREGNLFVTEALEAGASKCFFLCLHVTKNLPTAQPCMMICCCTTCTSSPMLKQQQPHTGSTVGLPWLSSCIINIHFGALKNLNQSLTQCNELSLKLPCANENLELSWTHCGGLVSQNVSQETFPAVVHQEDHFECLKQCPWTGGHANDRLCDNACDHHKCQCNTSQTNSCCTKFKQRRGACSHKRQKGAASNHHRILQLLPKNLALRQNSATPQLSTCVLFLQCPNRQPFYHKSAQCMTFLFFFVSTSLSALSASSAF